MTTLTKSGSPRQFRVKGETIIVRRLGADCVEPLIEFAQALPKEDLLFLERDITRQPEVDLWVKKVEEGELFTIVACQDAAIVGYATLDRGSAPWTQHVAELRVMVAESARRHGIGKLLLQIVFETALEEGVTKVVARMTPDQSEAQRLFHQLGFEQEAVLRENAMDANGLTHDLIVLSFLARLHDENRCGCCGVPVLSALSLDGTPLCSLCYELRYQELGDGG